MPLNSSTLTTVAEEIARSPIEKANLDEHSATLSALLDEIDKLRQLPLKAYEPRLVFLPFEE